MSHTHTIQRTDVLIGSYHSLTNGYMSDFASGGAGGGMGLRKYSQESSGFKVSTGRYMDTVQESSNRDTGPGHYQIEGMADRVMKKTKVCQRVLVCCGVE